MKVQQGDSPQAVVRSEGWRAAGAILAPIVALILLPIALWSAGYSLGDYPGLMRDGRLSWLTQLVMWAGVVAWFVVYYPPAWRALKNRDQLVVDGDGITLPSGERVEAHQIESIQLRKGMVHHIVLVKTSTGVRKVTVTYAVGGLKSVREAIISNPRLASVLES